MHSVIALMKYIMQLIQVKLQYNKQTRSQEQLPRRLLVQFSYTNIHKAAPLRRF